VTEVEADERDYSEYFFTAARRDREAREEAYGPEVGWWGSLGKMEEWYTKGYEIENFWVDNRAIGWRVKGRPEEGAIVFVP